MVACQGVEGAYSQIACEKMFKSPFIMYFKNFDGVFNAIDKGLCQYGILPIENSTAGSVKKVYDLMIHHNFSIVRTFRMKIDHNLIANPGAKLSDIKEITLPNIKNPFFKILRELARPLVRFVNRIIIKIMSRRFIKLAKEIEPDFIIDNSDSFINGKFTLKNSAIIKLIHGKFDIYKNFDLDGLQNFVLLSSKELNKFKTKYPNANFYIIPNFIPNISNLNTNYSQKVVVSIGRLSKEKGFLRLIDIWKLIQDSKDVVMKQWMELFEKIKNKNNY
jgi:glycosyltransferase involved in cell wall biosynthesis